MRSHPTRPRACSTKSWSPSREPQQGAIFRLDERGEIAREVLADIPGVRVEGFSSLLIDFAAA